MIQLLKKIYIKPGIKGFTIIEVLISLSILFFAIVSVLAVYTVVFSSIAGDNDIQKAVSFSEEYLTRLYLADDLKTALFKDSLMSNLNTVKYFPLLIKPEKTNISENIDIFINKKIYRLDPLVADIGIEAIISGKKDEKIRHYWVECTFSEKYLNKLEGKGL